MYDILACISDQEPKSSRMDQGFFLGNAPYSLCLSTEALFVLLINFFSTTPLLKKIISLASMSADQNELSQTQDQR